MWMVMQVLTPCVQNGRNADVGSEVLGIGSNDGESLCCSFQQQAIDDGLVLISDPAKRSRQPEHQVEIRYRQELSFARRKPSRCRLSLAFTAVPIAAGNGQRPLPVLWADPVMGSWRRLDRALVSAAANSAHHYEVRLRSAISLSDGWNAPRRRCGGTIDSMASSFSVGSPRV
jgi:hypothetical protein